MRIRLGRHEFEGPYVSSERLNDWPGIYAIVSITSGVTTVIDIAATDRIKRHVQRPEKVDEWREIARGRGLGVAVLYTHSLPPEQRRAIEHDIRQEVKVVCKPANNSSDDGSGVRPGSETIAPSAPVRVSFRSLGRRLRLT